MVLLATPKEWESGFKLAFNVDVYFVNTKQFLNLPWDTENPIVIHYSDFNPIRLRTYGSYCFSAEQKPIVFIRNMPGIVGYSTSESITEQLNTFVINKFTDYLGNIQKAELDLSSNLNEFSRELIIALKDDFSEYGIELTNLLSENISFSEVVQIALGKSASRGVIGNIITYTQMQFA